MKRYCRLRVGMPDATLARLERFNATGLQSFNGQSNACV